MRISQLPSFLGAVLLALLVGCAALTDWLEAPAGGDPEAPAGPDGSVTFELPGGGSLTLPAAPQSDVELPLPGGGSVVIRPGSSAGHPAADGGPAAAPPATNADAVAQAGGGLVALLTGGNAQLGVLAAFGMRTLLGALGSRRKKPPAPVAAPAA